MDGHVDVEGDVVELKTVDVVVVHLEHVIEHETGLGDLETSDLGDDVKDSGLVGRNDERGALVADRGHLRVDDDSRLDEHLVLELDGSELVALIDGLLGLSKHRLSLLCGEDHVLALLASLEVVLVGGDTLVDKALVGEEVVEGGLQAGDLLSLLLTDRAAVGNFKGNVMDKAFIVVLLGDHLSVLETTKVLEDLVDLRLEGLVLGLSGVLDTRLEHIHEVETVDRALHGNETQDGNDELLGLGVDPGVLGFLLHVDLEAVGERELNLAVITVLFR
mmetsp:Transcript_20213/g.33720  ORF Transcript_20213/g.33720 Transcript_20213/m.33720 type:complete len:276 (-) Transcript_20213:282-1109(-)